MRKRLTALAAVGLLVAGAWLGNLFRGFGLGGSGTGEGQAETPSADTQVNLGAEASRVLLTSSATTGPAAASAISGTTEAVAAATDDVLTILVVEDTYHLQSGTDAAAEFAPTTLAALVEQAKAHAGDKHGIRVRLRFRRNAQSGAISDLYAALQAAGIAREQVIEATGFVE